MKDFPFNFFFFVEKDIVSIEPSLDRRPSSNILKKHVKFPEDFKCVDDEVLFTHDFHEDGSCTVAIDSPPSIIASLQF